MATKTDSAYFDREGTEIPYRVWQDLRNDDDYVCVLDEQIPDKDVEVKTSWIGQDTSDGRNPVPLIFQTVVYVPSDGRSPAHGEAGMRYATEAEARDGHEKAVSAVTLLIGNHEPPFTAGIDWFEGRGDN